LAEGPLVACELLQLATNTAAVTSRPSRLIVPFGFILFLLLIVPFGFILFLLLGQAPPRRRI
jgi:hypothetical protein